MESPRLPEEVIEEVIVRLPAKSIIRFQAVKKSWLHLIKSSRFIRKHQIESEECCLALGFTRSRSRVQWDSLELSTPFFCDLMKKANLYKLFTFPDLNVELPPYSWKVDLEGDRCWYVLGDYNGILCLTNYKSIMLFNPSWKELKKLPNPIPKSPGYWFCKLVGVGFDNVTMDFKVVRLLEGTPMYDYNVLEVRAEVYSLRSNSWIKLNGCPNLELVGGYLLDCCTFFNGVIYWCFHRGILTFNLSDNAFNELQPPQDMDESRKSSRLFVLNQESLAFLSYARSSNCLSLWMFGY